jgi:hypothetical protein
MKDSDKVRVTAIVFIVLGGALLLGASSISIPSVNTTFLGIPYAVNPAFVSSFNEMIALYMVGFLFLGCGLGALMMTTLVYSLEKKLFQTPPPPPPINPSFSASFCRYCGTQNARDAVFCSKCGKRL